jgi:hypothetical protein
MLIITQLNMPIMQVPFINIFFAGREIKYIHLPAKRNRSFL